MSSDVQRIRQCGWSDLCRLWAQIQNGDCEGWQPGKALEHLILRSFELSGATVTWPYTVKMGGVAVEQIDGAVHGVGPSCLVECKDTKEPVNFEPIAKLRSQLMRRHASVIGILVSRAGVTEPALKLVTSIAPQMILLWNGDDVAIALEVGNFTRALEKKFQFCVERGAPDYSLMLEAVP